MVDMTNRNGAASPNQESFYPSTPLNDSSAFVSPQGPLQAYHYCPQRVRNETPFYSDQQEAFAAMSGALRGESKGQEVTARYVTGVHPVNGQMIIGSNMNMMNQALSQPGQLSSFHQKMIEVAHGVDIVLAHSPQFTRQEAIALTGHVMNQENIRMKLQASFHQAAFLQNETEANKERHHQENRRANQEDPNWRVALSKCLQNSIRLVSATTCSWAILLTLHMTATSVHDAIVTAYYHPIAFMDNIVCGVEREPELEDAGASEPVQQTWTGWFASYTGSYFDPSAWMSTVFSWVYRISRCPGTYVGSMVGSIVLWLFILALNQIPVIGPWINPLCTVIAIAIMAKETLDWIQFWWIVVAVLIYAVASSFGLTFYYIRARRALSRKGSDPCLSEVYDYGDVFENVQLGLILTQFVVAFFMVVQWCLLCMK